MKSSFFTHPTIQTHFFSCRKAHFLATVFLLLTCTFLQAQDVLMGMNSDGGIEGKGTIFSIKTDASKAFNVIKGFADWGQAPKGDLVLGPDGNYYGMTPQGGTNNHGTIFRITPKGEMTIIKHLDMKPDGGAPAGSLILARDGNFYGMTSNGGLYWGGVIFRLTPDGKYSVLRSFNTGADGYSPQGSLVQDADGSFYGLTSSGGAGYNGTIFKYNATSNVYTVLKAFNGNTEGGKPEGSLVQGSDAAFYGMTRIGGTYNSGVVFRISGTSYSVIRHLNGKTDGGNPRGNLIKAKDGFLYGMTPDGGVNYGGTIFKINNTGTTFSVVKAMSASLQGGQPYGSLVQASDDNFYGMAYTIYGGYSGCIFKLTANGTTLSVVKKFTRETEGSALVGNLIQGADGLLYGMAQFGGKYNSGTLFKTTTSGTTFTVLGHFNGATEGNVPQEGLVIGKDSAYFGVTQYGGAFGNGTVFKMCGGVVTVIKSFDWTLNGAKPQGGLLRGKDGNLYGMTQAGGTYGGGTIYKVVPATSTFSVIRHLKAATDGASPQGNLVQGPDDFLYGMAFNGGTNYAGTIFKINTSGTVFNVLRHLVPATDGTNPQAGLTFKDSVFYGMTGGSNTRFFKIAPNGRFTLLKTLNSSTEGYNPVGSMIVGTDGALYGTLQNGGANAGGTVFRITTGGLMTVLRALSNPTDGAYPKGGLVQGSDGAFYGTTSIGGVNKFGTVFRVTTAKVFSVLRSFNIATDGGSPQGGLVIAPKVVLVANPQSGLTTIEDVAKAITLTGSGAPNLTFAVTTAPRHGFVSSGTGAARTYTPRPNFYGVDSFAFVSSLGCLSSAPAWVKINVTPVNDTPKLAPIGTLTVAKGKLLNFTAIVKDPDPGQTKTFSLIGAPGGATINASTGVFSWTPTATGTFTFKVRVTDNGSPILYSEQTVTVNVTATTLMVTTTANALTVNKQAEEKATSAKSRLYPNLVTNRFTVEFGVTVQQVQVTIADLKGVVVYSGIQTVNGRQLQLDATSFSAGQYFLQVQSTQGTEVLKFVKL